MKSHYYDVMFKVMSMCTSSSSPPNAASGTRLNKLVFSEADLSFCHEWRDRNFSVQCPWELVVSTEIGGEKKSTLHWNAVTLIITNRTDGVWRNWKIHTADTLILVSLRIGRRISVVLEQWNNTANLSFPQRASCWRVTHCLALQNKITFTSLQSAGAGRAVICDAVM